MNDPEAPSTLVIMLCGMLLMGGFIVFLWAVNKIKYWRAGATSAKGRPSPPPVRKPASAVSAPERAPAITTPRMLTLREWLDRVNNQPDRVPHIAAKGPSGSGKTTLILATLIDRPGQVLICTPKNAKDDPWGGAPAVRLTSDLSFDAIEAALCAVHQEVKRRNVEGFDEWLTVVIDDYPWIAQDCPSAAKIVTLVGNMGRSVRVRLILLAQTSTVKSWGFEGNGEARANFVFVDLEEDHSAVLYRWGKQPEPIDTSCVFELAQRPIPQVRWWNVMNSVSSPVQDAEPLNWPNSAYESAEPKFNSDVIQPEIAQIVQRMKAELNLGKNEIIRLVWGAKPGGTRAYKEASTFYDTIIGGSQE